MNAEIDPTRLARAVHLDYRRLDGNRYLVRGGSQDHIVDVVNGAVRCDCYDARYRSGDGCKHSLLMRLVAGDAEVVKALRQLIAPPRRLRRVA